MRLTTLLSVLVSLSLSSCAGVAYRGSVAVETPDLVYVGPGVQVIADYDEPIFYADGFYWWFWGTTWYRSSDYTGGWIVASPPRTIISINPHGYRHYRPAGYVRHRHPVPSHKVKRPVVVRDHRPAVRDHRRRH
jgi:hypothetical protein